MDKNEMREAFEKFFEKYKKTEGDRSSWSAFWMEAGSGGALEITMTKCPEGTTFKFFTPKGKYGDAKGWDEFFATLEKIGLEFPGLPDADAFFTSMRDNT